MSNLRSRFLIGNTIYDFKKWERREIDGVKYTCSTGFYFFEPPQDEFNNLYNPNYKARKSTFLGVVNYDILFPQEYFLVRDHQPGVVVSQYEPDNGVPGPHDMMIGSSGGWYIYKTPTDFIYQMVALPTERNPSEPIRLPWMEAYIPEIQVKVTPTPTVPVVSEETPRRSVYIPLRRGHQAAVLEEGSLFDFTTMKPYTYDADGWPIYDYQNRYYKVTAPTSIDFPSVEFTDITVEILPPLPPPPPIPAEPETQSQTANLATLMIAAGGLLILFASTQ